MNVIVVGGGKVGFYLIRTLLEHGHIVSVIEKDSARCQVLAQEYQIRVINGDGTNSGHLLDAGADRADVLTSVTGKDEENLLVCQIAKQEFEIGRVIARVNNPKNEEVFRKLGIALAVSSTGVIANLIEREMAWGRIRTLLTFHHGDMNIVEMDLTGRAPAVGKKLADLAPELPPEAIVVAVMRDDEVVIPRGFTALKAGDTVMALVHRDAAAALQRVLLGEE